IQEIKSYYALDEETPEYIQLGQEFDIITDTDLIECKRINGGIEEYIPNLKRQKLFTTLVKEWLYSWSFEKELTRDRVIQLIQDKSVYCSITYKQPLTTARENTEQGFNQMLHKSSSRSESRATSETKILSHGIGIDNGDSYIYPIDISKCATSIKNLSQESAIAVLAHAKEDTLFHGDRPITLHIIMRDDQATLLKNLLSFAGFITPKELPEETTRIRSNSAPENPVSPSMMQHRLSHMPASPVETFRKPVRVTHLRTTTPSRNSRQETLPSPTVFINEPAQPAATLQKPTPGKKSPGAKNNAQADKKQPDACQ
ncbi:hypothetical protein, partial [Methylicorpusculum sp.]|uniref:hypothetical protein n=1 Tax=Methylicorpusculum sp. TaxID=2713644 RepID=UPI002AB8AD89